MRTNDMMRMKIMQYEDFSKLRALLLEVRYMELELVHFSLRRERARPSLV